MSRSRYVRMSSRRQRRLSGSERARYERGNPPLRHRRAPFLRPDLVEGEAGQFVIGDAAGQRLGRLAQEIGGSAAQDEEATRHAGFIYEDAQAGEELGPPVHLVHHDEAFQGPESKQGIRKKGEVLGALEVEERGPTAATADELAGEGGLADLAWAEDRHNRELPQQGRERPQVACPFDHGPYGTTKSDRLSSNFQGRGTRRPAALEGGQRDARDRVRRGQRHARLGGGHHAPESH